LSGNELYSLKSATAANAVVEKCSYINCDVRGQGQFIHYERACGKCNSFEDALQNFAASAIEAQACTNPSKNRWGTLHEALKEQAPGLMVLRSLPRSVRRAFGRWQDGDPGADDPEDYRQHMRCKCWRARKCVGPRRKQLRHLTMFYVSKPMTHLWRRLEWLDEQGGGLLDVSKDESNPFV
jgi:Ni/Co efflux regulator RcnB